MTIQELPTPLVTAGMVLVRNHYSLISAGTEGSTVRAARKSLIGKAQERPQQLKQVLDVLRKQGPVQTYRAVMKKLDAYSPLGYSSAGEVIDVGGEVKSFAVGDLVACAGVGYANHAEIVSVPVNLCVKLPMNADLKAASYNTLGAIAMQGIRQADLRLGESCAVIGLGLIGQLTCLLLRASGVKTFGIDIDSSAVESARINSADYAWIRSEAGITAMIQQNTCGLGVDAVIITAGSSSLDPINFAGEISRKKGRVVVVGAVPTGFDREPYYYKKELEVLMSCSYGPGRYELNYEEKGQDYPPAYVRWTENRNMQAFQELIHGGRIKLDYLTTHEVPLDRAAQAYDMIVSHTEPYLGVVLKYDISKTLTHFPIQISNNERTLDPSLVVGIAFIGAGSYAQGNLLPNIPKNDRTVLCKGVMTQSGTTSKRVAEKYGFEFCTSEIEDLLGDKKINTVFISTRHDSHATYVKQALSAGKNVFVEKPLCLTSTELDEIQQCYQSVAIKLPPPQLMIGFNRRFAPHAVTLKKRLANAPMAMLYRVNAGVIPADSWYQDPVFGGGRIIGEVCHFIDFQTWLCGSLPVSVSAVSLPDPNGLNDTVNIQLSFANGSVGTVSYFANGSSELHKEYIEVYQAGLTGIIKDFKFLEIYSKGKPVKNKLFNQDKGQSVMVRSFIERVKTGGTALINPEEIFGVTRATFGVLKSLQMRQIELLEEYVSN